MKYPTLEEVNADLRSLIRLYLLASKEKQVRVAEFLRENNSRLSAFMTGKTTYSYSRCLLYFTSINRLGWLHLDTTKQLNIFDEQLRKALDDLK